MSFLKTFKSNLGAAMSSLSARPYNDNLTLLASVLTSLAMLLLPSNEKVAIAGINYFQIRVIVFALYGIYLSAVYPSAKRDAPTTASVITIAIIVIVLVIAFDIARLLTTGA